MEKSLAVIDLPSQNWLLCRRCDEQMAPASTLLVLLVACTWRYGGSDQQQCGVAEPADDRWDYDDPRADHRARAIRMANEARARARARENERARALLARARALTTRRPGYTRARARFAQGRHELALRTFQAAARHTPSAGNLMNLGVALMRKAELLQARRRPPAAASAAAGAAAWNRRPLRDDGA